MPLTVESEPSNRVPVSAPVTRDMIADEAPTMLLTVYEVAGAAVSTKKNVVIDRLAVPPPSTWVRCVQPETVGKLLRDETVTDKTRTSPAAALAGVAMLAEVTPDVPDPEVMVVGVPVTAAGMCAPL